MIKLSWRMVPLLLATALLTIMLIALTEYSEEDRSLLIGKGFPLLTVNVWDEETPALAETLENDNYKLVNIFASWCVPCLAEMPMIEALRKDHNLTTIGVLWRDDIDHARTWISKVGAPFSHIYIDRKGASAVELGIYGVPESFLLDKNGTIVWHLAGPLTQQAIDNEIIPLITE